MFWILVILTITLAIAEDVKNNSEQTNWPYIKNLISTKLFGKQSTIIIQQPEIPKNKSYQLIQIEGNNILINLTRAEEKEMPSEMISAEMAIIKSYLGTTTNQETLLAIEAAKNLVTSGVLDDERDGDTEYQSYENDGQESNYVYSDKNEFTDKNSEREEVDTDIDVRNTRWDLKYEYSSPQKLDEGFLEDDLQIGEEIAKTKQKPESFLREPITPSVPNMYRSPAGLNKPKAASNKERSAAKGNLDKSVPKTPREYIFTPPDNVDSPVPPLNSFLSYLFNA